MAEPTPAPTPAAPDVRLLRSITLRNILSFGPDTPPLELRALNVLIGPNGSGKSNLLDGINLLREASDSENLRVEVGGEYWMHKGTLYTKGNPTSIIAKIKAQGVDIGDRGHLADLLDHSIVISDGHRFGWTLQERIEDVESNTPYFDSTDYQISVNSGDSRVSIEEKDFDRRASVLSQLRGLSYPAISLLTRRYRSIRLYREWTFGRNSGPRLPRRTDERNDFLAEDGSNLGLVLSKLSTYPEIKDKFIDALNELYEGIKDFSVLTEGGTAQIFLREGNTSIPATRLSDGTLRYLCLLAILLHPTPPPLICLEEPELGLHPDAVVAVGKLIKEASTRTQLIITTHSRILIDTFQDSPEDVVVVSKQDGSTRMERLDADKLRPYLDTYSLSNLWSSGDIGGNRWS